MNEPTAPSPPRSPPAMPAPLLAPQVAQVQDAGPVLGAAPPPSNPVAAAKGGASAGPAMSRPAPPKPQPQRPAQATAAQHPAAKSAGGAARPGMPHIAVPSAVVDLRHDQVVEQTARPGWRRRLLPPAFGILLPTLVVLIYLYALATSRWTAEAQVSLKDALGADGSPSLSLSRNGLSFGGSNPDDALVAAYFQSNDLALSMDRQLGLRAYWQNRSHDLVFRLSRWATVEDYQEYFKSHTEVSVDPNTGVTTVRAQAYEPEFAKKLVEAMVARAEVAVNGFGQDVIHKRLAIFEEEVARTERELKAATQALLAFQTEHNLLDAHGQAESGAGMVATMDADLATAQAALAELLSIQGEFSEAVIRQHAKIKAIQDQRSAETALLVGKNTDGAAVNTLVAAQADLDFNVQRRTEAYGLALKALEEARVEASHEFKHLVVIDPPTLPERTSQPRIIYWTLTVFIALVLVYVIAAMIVATIREHRD